MTNDAKWGLVVGMGIVVALAIIYRGERRPHVSSETVAVNPWSAGGGSKSTVNSILEVETPAASGVAKSPTRSILKAEPPQANGSEKSIIRSLLESDTSKPSSGAESDSSPSVGGIEQFLRKPGLGNKGAPKRVDSEPKAADQDKQK